MFDWKAGDGGNLSIDGEDNAYFFALVIVQNISEFFE
jgi:hypothetical protein